MLPGLVFATVLAISIQAGPKGGTCHITATAQQGTAAITQFDLMIDGRVVSSATSETIAYTWNLNNVSNNTSHAVKATAIDQNALQASASVVVGIHSEKNKKVCVAQ